MSELLLDVKGLSKHYPAGTRLFGPQPVVRALDDVSLSVRPSENVGLVGESGCGKSTFGRALLRLVEPTAGTVFFDGTEVTRLGRGGLRELRKQAQMIFQDPYSSLNPRMRVHDILAEPLRIHRLCRTPAEERERTAELVHQVGLAKDCLGRYPHEFSGGQRQRIGIARALAVRPKFIVADEPVSALDVSVQAQIVNLLSDIKDREGLTYLFISHDLKVVEHLCQTVAVMYLGRIVEKAATGALYRRQLHPYSQALLAAIPQPPSVGTSVGAEPDATRQRRRLELVGDPPSPSAPPSGCPFHPRCPRYRQAGEPARCREEAPPLRELESARAEADGSAHLVACHLAE